MRLRIALLLLIAIALPRLWPHAPLSARVAQSTAVWSADGQLLRVTLATDDQYRMWTPLPDISSPVVEAFLLKEDRWFYWHPGVNPIALTRAAFTTWRGGVRQGGSTITMQVARLLLRLNTRTPGGKLRQAAEAVWLEARYSKREILEAYLNLAPFGSNIEGIGVASRVFFGKDARSVTLGEALSLAVVPQHPAARGNHSNAASPGFQKARAELARLWLASHHASDSDQRQLSLSAPVSGNYPLPWRAPHFVDALVESGIGPGRFSSTLDTGLQSVLERQIAGWIGAERNRGVGNAAALLVDTRDMGVKAWVGSSAWDDASIHGQVNGVLARRSPGSALKPFVYALALDQGVLHPRTILRDAPTSFGAFTPENFDGQFAGPISAQDALIRSRNIPAVWVATQLKQPDFYQFLKSSGVRLPKPASWYGLGLALGGGEVSMEEMATLYSMLASKGMLRPLREAERAPEVIGERVLSEEASFITLDMLSHNPRPDDTGIGVPSGRLPVAWKTGTSWGFRDAWSAGVVGPWVLVVWVGDFESRGNPAFVGVETAAPLFFRIVDGLSLERPNEPVPVRRKPAGVSRVAVCAESGDLPNADCPNTVETWYIPEKSPIRVSRLHRAVMVDSATGGVVCGDTPGATRMVVAMWSSDMLRLFRESGMPRRTPPKMSDCGADDAADAPRITSPLRGVEYSPAKSESIGLDAAVASDVRSVFWFDGNALLGKAVVSPGGFAWYPSSGGLHLIRVIDDHGRSAERDVEVHLGR